MAWVSAQRRASSLCHSSNDPIVKELTTFGRSQGFTSKSICALCLCQESLLPEWLDILCLECLTWLEVCGKQSFFYPRWSRCLPPKIKLLRLRPRASPLSHWGTFLRRLGKNWTRPSLRSLCVYVCACVYVCIHMSMYVCQSGLPPSLSTWFLRQGLSLHLTLLILSRPARQ